MGGKWGDLQGTALGDGPLEKASIAAMELFVIAAEDISELMDERQRAVVEHAYKLAEKRIRGQG